MPYLSIIYKQTLKSTKNEFRERERERESPINDIHLGFHPKKTSHHQNRRILTDCWPIPNSHPPLPREKEYPCGVHPHMREKMYATEIGNTFTPPPPPPPRREKK